MTDARRPACEVRVDDQDITARLSGRLIEIVVTDQDGTTSDSVEIALDDRTDPQAGRLALPRTGARVTVRLGYQGDLGRVGVYTVSEVILAGPPDTLTIRAQAADLREALKAPRTRTWDDVTFGALVQSIADAHGYTPRVGEFLAPIHFPHIHQQAESDLNLLTRLGRQYGATVKPTSQYLIVAEQGAGKSVSGLDLAPVALTRADMTHWQATGAERSQYGSVVAYYQDLAGAERRSVTVGDGAPVFALATSYGDAARANQAAQAKWSRLRRSTGQLRFGCVGRPDLLAEAPLTISGMRDGIDGAWVLTSVTHRYSPRGYVCECVATRPKK